MPAMNEPSSIGAKLLDTLGTSSIDPRPPLTQNKTRSQSAFWNLLALLDENIVALSRMNSAGHSRSRLVRRIFNGAGYDTDFWRALGNCEKFGAAITDNKAARSTSTGAKTCCILILGVGNRMGPARLPKEIDCKLRGTAS
jgi:hypothetical protein